MRFWNLEAGLVAERQEATSAGLGETYGGSNVGNFGGVQSEARFGVDGPPALDPDSFAASGYGRV